MKQKIDVKRDTELVETTRKKDWRICRREITGNSAEPIGIIVCWKRLTESQAVKLYAQYMKALVVELSESEQDIETVIEHDGHYYWLEDAFDDPYGLSAKTYYCDACEWSGSCGETYSRKHTPTDFHIAFPFGSCPVCNNTVDEAAFCKNCRSIHSKTKSVNGICPDCYKKKPTK